MVDLWGRKQLMARGFVIFLLLLGANPAQSRAETLFRVLSYNIHHGAGVDRKIDLQRIADVIDSVDPDLVALQEVDQNVARSQRVDQPAELARLTGMKAVFYGNIPLQDGMYGNAILSKFPLRSSSHLLLPNHNEGEQRGMIVADVDAAGISDLRFIATHFDHRRDESERVASAERVNAIALQHPKIPMILAGDLNATRSSKSLQILKKQWRIAGPELATVPVNKPERQIDFILCRPAESWEVVDTQVLDEAVASDHRAILTILRFRPQANDTTGSRANLDSNSISQLDSVSDLEDWNHERLSILNAMQSIMGRLPKLEGRNPPEVTMEAETDCGSYVRRRIQYRSQSDNQNPAYLCIPKTALQEPSQSHPAVLCLHPTDNQNGNGVVVGLGGKANRQYASELAERGYVTLAPSYPLLAKYQPDLKQLGWESGTLLAVWDNMRAIDLLQSLSYVDDQAIGAMGHSLGGHNAVYTAAFDDRIKAVVSSCGLDSYRDYYDGDPKNWVAGRGWTQTRYMPKLADYHQRLDEIPFDFDGVLASIAPREVLVIAPLRDSNFRADSVDRLASTARHVYRLYDAPARLQVMHPACDHDFPSDMRRHAYALFDRVLVPQQAETSP
jgi:endonuclease/exonuclease/phosphatase family metal-dependent hydrolase/dienelactone hydrolase